MTDDKNNGDVKNITLTEARVAFAALFRGMDIDEFFDTKDSLIEYLKEKEAGGDFNVLLGKAMAERIGHEDGIVHLAESMMERGKYQFSPIKLGKTLLPRRNGEASLRDICVTQYGEEAAVFVDEMLEGTIKIVEG